MEVPAAPLKLAWPQPDARSVTADHRADREQTLLAQAEELAGAGSWDADLVAGTVQWSAGMYRIRDLEPCGEPISLALASADMHPADGPRVEAELAAALRTGCDQVSLSYRIVTAAGTRHLEGRARIEHDPDGVPVRMIGVTMDVSARRETEIAREQAERELRAREGLLSAVIENNPALIYAKDLEGRYLLYNEPLAEAFELERRGALEGCPARSVLLGRTDDWLDPELAPLWREADLRARLGTHRVEERFDHPQDGERFFDSIKFPLHDDDGYVIGTCGVSLETTKAKLLEAQAVRSSRYFDLRRDLVCTAGLDGHFKDLNDAWTQTLGWSAEELRARPFVEFVHADDRPQTEVIAAGLATGASAGQFVNRYATKHGDWRWLEWTAMMEDGTIYASARDITERKRAEDQIVRNEKLLADLLNSAPDAVVIADADWRITLVNAQTERLFGYERDELVGAPLQALMAERLRGRDAADDEDFGAGPAVHPITARSDLAGRRKDGSDFSVGKPLRPGELEEVLARALVVVPAPLVDPAGFSETMGGDDEARGKLVTLFLDRSKDAIASFAAAIDAGRSGHGRARDARAEGQCSRHGSGPARAGGGSPAARAGRRRARLRRRAARRTRAHLRADALGLRPQRR